jgi:hypothetical protein
VIIGRFVCSLMALAMLTGLPRLASARASSASPTGTPPPMAGAASAPLPGKSPVKVDMVPSLIVMNAAGASLDGQTLTLNGVSPNSIIFADRPTRAAGHLLTHHLTLRILALLPATARLRSTALAGSELRCS